MKRDQASWRRWPIIIIFFIFCTNVSFQVGTSEVKKLAIDRYPEQTKP